MEANSVIAVDIGGTKILGAKFDQKGRIEAREKKGTKTRKGDEAAFRQFTRVIDQLWTEEGSPVQAISIGVPGVVRDGVVVFAPNMPWKEYPLQKKIQEHYGVRCFVDNDANLSMLGEWRYGAGKNCQNLIGIFVGTGVGGGIVLNNQIYQGATGGAGEVGHIIVSSDGPYCGCGARGCLESLTSKNAIQKEIIAQTKRGRKSVYTDLIETDQFILKSSMLKRALEEKDMLTVDIMERVSQYLGIGTASIVNLLDPEIVIFGGGIMEAVGPYLLPKIITHAQSYAILRIMEKVKIELSALKDDACLYGAYALALMGES